MHQIPQQRCLPMSAATPEKTSPALKSKPANKAKGLASKRTADDTAGSAAPGTLRLKTLIDRVAASTGGKKKGQKEIVEATLTQLGLALENGEMLNLPGFGRVRVAKAQGAAPGSAMTLKLRRGGKVAKNETAEQALADPADHG